MIDYECMKKKIAFLKVKKILKKGGGWQILCITWS
jgi:hypothetical protein